MTLQLKTITAFALSFAVTLVLAVVNYHESRQIESSLNRLQLSGDQLRKLDQLQRVFDSHQQALSNFLLTEDETHLVTTDSRMEQASRMIDSLIEINGVELQSPIESLLDTREATEEKTHLQLLLGLRGRLAKANSVVEPIVALEQRGSQEQAETLMFDDYNNGYLRDLKAIVEKLHSGEASHFDARRAQHDHAVASLRSSAKWYGIVGGAVAVLAVLFLKESLDEMAEAKRRETDANIAKSTFLANMSHEIRTPLNGILGFARLLMRNPAIARSSKASEYVTTILNSGRHLLNLINDVLDLSKVEAGQFSCERVACEVVPLMEEVVSLVRVRANSKGLPLELSWAGPVPEVIQTDPVRFKQILVNLIGNAVKFTDRGRVTVVAWLDRSLGRSDIVVEVADTGIGIAGKDKAAIFKPFFQADNSLTRQYEGTGLGLADSCGELGGDARRQYHRRQQPR